MKNTHIHCLCFLPLCSALSSTSSNISPLSYVVALRTVTSRANLVISLLKMNAYFIDTHPKAMYTSIDRSNDSSLSPYIQPRLERIEERRRSDFPFHRRTNHVPLPGHASIFLCALSSCFHHRSEVRCALDGEGRRIMDESHDDLRRFA